MRKIFRNYTVIIITIAIFSILAINSFMIASSTRKRQLNNFKAKIDQVIHTMEENQVELENISRNLDEDYLTRAKAAAYVIEKNPEVAESVSELRKLGKLLNVDEVHVIDENGVIVYSSVPKYIGIDFHDGKQTGEFLWLLEDESGEDYFVQEAQPNFAEQKIMKYVGVTREGRRGIIQVGLRPVRQQEAQERNTYKYIFDRFPTDVGEEYFAVDCNTDILLAHSGDEFEGHSHAGYSMQNLEGCEKGAFRIIDGQESYYIVTRQYADVLIGISIPRDILFRRLLGSILTVFFYLFLIEIVIVLLMDYLVRRKVVDGIYAILGNLTQISNGNFDTVVDVGGNPEFEELSSGISTMVKSILSSSDRISRIIEMSEIPLAAFEYQSSMKYVFITSGLGELLGLSEGQIKQLYREPGEFLAEVQRIMEVPVEAEDSVFQVADRFIRIHLSINGKEYLGVVTDVTKEVLENRRIRYENNHDQLTGLCKYNYFRQQASEKLGQKQDRMCCACVMVDLDRFKSINDTYGHDLGDIYLQSFAQVMKVLPEERCLTARRSGDEFCLLIHGNSREEIRQQLHRFWELLAAKKIKVSAEKEIAISASGGVAYADDGCAELEFLMHRADIALYQAKREQKGSYMEYIPQEDENGQEM